MAKKRKKITAALTLIGIISSVLLMWVPAAYADFSCTMLNDPKETKDYLVTINEEQFGSTTGSTADVDGSSIQCFRKTECHEEKPEQPADSTQEAVPVMQCKSTYENTCEPNIAGGVTCNRVQAFFGTSGTGLLFAYIGTIYRWSAGVIGVITVLYLVVGGIEIAIAGDNTGKIDEAKQKILQSIAGLVLLFLSAVILYTINPNFFTI